VNTLEDLRRQNRTLLKLVDTMHCGLVARDADGIVVFVNERLRSWLQYSQEEMLGKPVEELVPPETRDLMLAEMKAVDSGDVRARLTAVQRKDSTTFPVLTLPQQLRDEDGRLIGGFSIVIDLGTVQTAKRTMGSSNDLRTTLDRIAMELQSLSLAADTPAHVVLPIDHPDLKTLSPREKEVLALLVGGARVPAIAKRLHRSPHTIRNHLKSMYRKLEVGTQSDLIERVHALSASPKVIQHH
jgi:PAS domain S-box-containing protein